MGKGYVWVALRLNFLGMSSASAVDWRFRNHYFYFRIAVSVSDIGTCFWFQFVYSEQKFVFWRFLFISDTSRWFLFLFEATVKLNVYSRKYCSVAAKVQAELKSFCGKTYRLAFGLVQRWRKPFGKAKALEFEKKKGTALHTDASSVVWARTSYAWGFNFHWRNILCWRFLFSIQENFIHLSLFFSSYKIWGWTS